MCFKLDNNVLSSSQPQDSKEKWKTERSGFPLVLFSLSVSLVSSGSTYKASKLPVLRHHQTRKTCDIQWRWKNPERKEQQPLPLKKQPTTQCIPRRTPRLAYNRIPFNLAPPFSMGGLPKCWDYFRHSGQNTPLLGFCSKNIYSSYSSFTVQRPLRW